MADNSNDSGFGCGALLIGGGVLYLLAVVWNFLSEAWGAFDIEDHVYIPIFKTILVVGLTWGVLIALVNFIVSLRHFFNRPSRQWKPFISKGEKKEPSREQYLYWRGDWLANTWAVCKENFQVNWRCISHYFYRIFFLFGVSIGLGCLLIIPCILFVNLPSIVYYLGRALILVFGILLLLPPLLLISLLIGTTAALVFTTTALAFSLLEWLISTIRGVFALCPSCNRRVSRLSYICPNCGQKHFQLAPSPKYGIFTHRCNCGKLLPTSRLWGRARLVAHCPHCDAPFAAGAGTTIPKTLAFIGTPGSGKSYLEAAIISCVLKPGNSLSCKASFSRNAEAGQQLLQVWSRGESLSSSLTREAALLGVDVSKTLSLAPRRIYCHAPVGSAFQSMRELAMQSYYNHLACAVFVIDPYTIPSVAAALRHRGAPIPQSVSSATSADDLFGRWMIAINEFHQNALRKSACAMVITHLDNPHIQAVTGLEPGASHERCMRFLEENGLHSLLPQMDEFQTTRLFAVSSVPTSGNTTTAHSSVEELAGWMIDKSVF